MPLEVHKMPYRVLFDNDPRADGPRNYLLQARKMAQAAGPHVPTLREIDTQISYGIPILLPQAVEGIQNGRLGSDLSKDTLTYFEQSTGTILSARQYDHLLKWVTLEIGCGSITEFNWLAWASFVVWGNREVFSQALPSLMAREMLAKPPAVWHVSTGEIWETINTTENNGYLCGIHVDTTHYDLLVQQVTYNALLYGELQGDLNVAQWEHFTAGRIPKVTFDDRRERLNLQWSYIHESVVGQPPIAVLINGTSS